MPADPQDLVRRVAAATARDTVRGIIFNSAFALVREHVGDPAAAACDPRGTGGRSEYFSYPVADYLRIAWAAVASLESRLGSVDEVFAALGARAAERWLASPFGRVLHAFAGSDPRRILANAANGYRNVVSYGMRTVEWLGPRHARLVFRRDFLVPPFHSGVLGAALWRMSRVRLRVEGREVGFLESDYDVTW